MVKWLRMDMGGSYHKWYRSQNYDNDGTTLSLVVREGMKLCFIIHYIFFLIFKWGQTVSVTCSLGVEMVA